MQVICTSLCIQCRVSKRLAARVCQVQLKYPIPGIRKFQTTGAKALLAASQESYDANLDTYRQGLSTIVELLTADRDLANARYTIIQSRADLLTSSAAVAYAVGAIEMPRP